MTGVSALDFVDPTFLGMAKQRIIESFSGKFRTCNERIPVEEE